MLSKVVNDQHDGFYKALDYLKKTGKLDASFTVDEFADEFKDEELLRPSFTVEDPIDPIDFPEFQPLIDALEIDAAEQLPVDTDAEITLESMERGAQSAPRVMPELPDCSMSLPIVADATIDDATAPAEKQDHLEEEKAVEN